jgi:hypothetical protein
MFQRRSRSCNELRGAQALREALPLPMLGLLRPKLGHWLLELNRQLHMNNFQYLGPASRSSGKQKPSCLQPQTGAAVF